MKELQYTYKNSIVPSKVQIPPLRSSLVNRDTLLQKLEPTDHHKLTIVMAPAGFGKSTLVQSWAYGRKVRAAWLSLELDDNDPVRFWLHVMTAFQEVIPELGKQTIDSIHDSASQDMKSVVTSLINELSTTQHTKVLVLDDYHLIQNTVIHDSLTYLLDGISGVLQIIITTRNTPPLPIARLRARGQLIEVTTEDLRFSRTEARSFFNEVMGLDLKQEAIRALELKTEGWVAGLQLAGLSLQHQDDISDFVASFTGDDRYIVDYLAEEILNQQSASTTDFLLKTSILERMNGNLCNAITGRDDGQETLEMLEHANLFIIPLDNRRQWYRYHHLFAAFLRQQLERQEAKMLADYHKRASQWYEEHHLVSEAIHHALAAEDIIRAATLIEGFAYTTRMRGEVSTVMAWLRALPQSFVMQRPRLCLEYAWCFIVSGQPDRSVPFIQAIEKQFNFEIETSSNSARNFNKQIRPLIGEAIAVQGKVSCDTGNPVGAIALFQQSRTYLPPDDYALQTIISLHLGTAYLTKGDIESGRQAYSDAVELSQASGNFNAAITALSRLGDLHLMQGQLNDADRHYRRAIQLATRDGRQPSPIATRAFAGIAQILGERNHSEHAIEHLETSIRLAEQGGHQRALATSLLTLAQELAHAGLMNRVQLILDRVDVLSLDPTLPWLKDMSSIVRAHIAFYLDDLEQTQFWLDQYQPECYTGLKDTYCLIKIYVLLKNGQTNKANALFSHIDDTTDTRLGNQIELGILRVLIYEQTGNLSEAERVLKPIITIGQAERYSRSFAKNTGLIPILRRLLTKGVMTEYISELLSIMESATQDNPLTERETEVLNLIAAGFANKEIAQELVVAVSTVKRHINHIYEKLAVRSRTQAIVRANELHLL